MENKEKGMFYDWSIRYGTQYRYPVHKNEESCFVKRGDENYMEEYYFETIMEIKTNLLCIWPNEKLMEDIIKPVAVAAMKNQPQNLGNKRKTQVLDEYIYMF